MLIIYAHPNKEWHCWYILEKIKKTLESKNEKYEVFDIYKMWFDPILWNTELYTSSLFKEKNSDIIVLQNTILNHDKYIIIYPTWWNWPPAILKWFFDRVLTSWFAFKYDWNIPKWLLKWKAVAITTTWWPKFYQILFVWNRSLKTIVNDTLSFCWLKSKWFLVWSANNLDEKKKLEIDKLVLCAFDYLH